MAWGSTIGLKMGKATREAFGLALAEAGRANPRIVVLDGDVGNSTRTEHFAKEFPDRFFNVGIAESNLVSIAAGLASSGKIPVLASFAAFVMCNAYDQLRMSVAFPGLPVKVVGTHAGISIGEDGPSQMGIEDVALGCSLPGFAVLVPADEPSARQATLAMIAHPGPVYLRAGRPNVPVVYPDGCDFRIGRAHELRAGTDVTIAANGIMVAMALEAAALLDQKGLRARVLDVHTAKPLDREALARAARETGAIVVAEEHLASGGLGAAVAMTLAELAPCPVRFVNLGDRFAESGAPDELLQKYGLTVPAILRAAEQAVAAKSR
jgi:transketolase